MALVLNILMWIVIIAVAFFVLTFTVYFFNLDMKMMAMNVKTSAKHWIILQRKYRWTAMHVR